MNSFNSAPTKKLAPANDNGAETPPVVHLTSTPASLSTTPEPAATAAEVLPPTSATLNNLQETLKPPVVAIDQAPTVPEATPEALPDTPVEPASDQQEILRDEAATLNTSIRDEQVKLRAVHEAAGVPFNEEEGSAAIRHHKQRLAEIQGILKPKETADTEGLKETVDVAPVEPETSKTSPEKEPAKLGGAINDVDTLTGTLRTRDALHTERGEMLKPLLESDAQKTLEKVYPRFETVADDVSRITGMLRKRDSNQLTPFLERNQVSSFFAAAQQLQDAQRMLDTNPGGAADAIRAMERALKNFGEVGGGRGIRESSESLRSLAIGMNGFADSLTSSKRMIPAREDFEEVRAGLATLSNRARSIAEFLGRRSRALRDYERR